LLQSVDFSKAEARDTSQAARVEAKLRAELNLMHSKRDEVVANCEEYKRTTILLEEELRQVKAKLSRVAQEKIKLERDQRVTMSLAKSLDSHSHSDTEYYKRKVSELTGHVQGLNSIISEKNRQLKELQHQIERNMSQGRLASISKDADASFKRRH
jgi:chromosome segregation ATPase